MPNPAPGTAPQPEWLSLGPASRLLGVDPDTLRRWADVGRIRTYTTPGGHRRFARTDLSRLQETRRSRRRTLAGLGATPERFSAAYARSYRASAPPVAAAGGDREGYRAEGRRLVELLLAYLDAPSPDVRRRHEAAAMEAAAATALRSRASGASNAAAVAAFVAARQPFLAELESLGRRRSLEAPAVTRLYADAAALLDRLLLHFVTVFDQASPKE